jgi:hypothetical protein
MRVCWVDSVEESERLPGERMGSGRDANIVRTIRVVKKRTYSPHHTLLHAARRSAARLKLKEPGWQADALTVLLASALAIEAFCNLVGKRTLQEWEDFEPTSPWVKVRMLSEHFDLGFSKGAEPWKSLWQLIKLRNNIAHGKPKEVVIDRLMTESEHEEDQQGKGDWFPFGPLEKELTEGKAQHALAAVEQFVSIVASKIDYANRFGLEVDSWTGTASIVSVTDEAIAELQAAAERGIQSTLEAQEPSGNGESDEQSAFDRFC